MNIDIQFGVPRQRKQQFAYRHLVHHYAVCFGLALGLGAGSGGMAATGAGIGLPCPPGLLRWDADGSSGRSGNAGNNAASSIRINADLVDINDYFMIWRICQRIIHPSHNWRGSRGIFNIGEKFGTPNSETQLQLAFSAPAQHTHQRAEFLGARRQSNTKYAMIDLQ